MNASLPPQPALAEEFQYHRLARASANYRWWRPIVAVVAAGLTWLLTSLLFGLVMLLVGVVWDTQGAFSTLINSGNIDMSSPWGLGLALGSIILMLPSVYVGALVSGRWHPGFLSSVAGRLRWKLLLKYSALALLIMVITNAGALLVAWLQGETLLVVPELLDNQRILVTNVVLVLVLVPFQAAAEEYVFRGLAMQTLGAWLKNPWWAILLPVPLFIIGHDYNWVGLLDVGVFAVAIAWLTWRTGGLEAGIGLHIMNNLVVMLLGVFGLADLNATEFQFSIYGLFASVVPVCLYAFLVSRSHKSPEVLVIPRDSIPVQMPRPSSA